MFFYKKPNKPLKTINEIRTHIKHNYKTSQYNEYEDIKLILREYDDLSDWIELRYFAQNNIMYCISTEEPTILMLDKIKDIVSCIVHQVCSIYTI